MKDSTGVCSAPSRIAINSREIELRERFPVPHDNFLNLFKVRALAAKVVFVCCSHDPRGLLSRERDMFRPQTFEV